MRRRDDARAEWLTIANFTLLRVLRAKGTSVMKIESQERTNQPGHRREGECPAYGRYARVHRKAITRRGDARADAGARDVH